MGTHIFAQKSVYGYAYALTDVFMLNILGKTPEEKFEGLLTGWYLITVYTIKIIAQKMNWNAESHNPQVHISNTLTERMFVKGPKKLFLKKITHVIPGAMICYWRKTLPKAASKRIRTKLKKCFVLVVGGGGVLPFYTKEKIR